MQVNDAPRRRAAAQKSRAPVARQDDVTGFAEVIDRDGSNLPSILLLVLMSSAPALPLSDLHAPAVSAMDDLWGKRKLIADKTRVSSETVSLTYSMVDLIRSVLD
ncbi:hypothetical protein [Lichenicoccus roseus]|uniref:Uncharacterized protein n=1 Tax=Lichenicoccus roseus TaxID=2683649 RepID=A0A5R9JEL5_9PROT|nr:hypothetical protein [Lichenicoccus roseus]TLU74081.1 hypothetical protein FE263_02385 [Lichenicoccus roseus]